MKRLVTLAVLGLAGCQTYAQRTELNAKMVAAAETCRTMPGSMTDRTRCLNDVENTYWRASYPYPDLMSLRHSTRVSIASRLDRREITKEQADVEFDRTAAEIQSEVVRRQTAIAGAQAQQSAASSAALIALGTGMMMATPPTPPAPGILSPSFNCTTYNYGRYSRSNCN